MLCFLRQRIDTETRMSQPLTSSRWTRIVKSEKSEYAHPKRKTLLF